MTDKHLRKLGGTVYSTKKVQSEHSLKILQKFGWKEGDGLGKNRDGIKECIQITKRYENEGLGKSYKKMNDVWWEDSFNNVLKNISFKNDQEGVHSRTRSRSISMTENEYFNKEKSKRDKIEKENSSNKKSNNVHKEEEKSKINDKGKKKEFKVEVKNKKVKVIHFSDDEE